jgi:LAS superfamily LD-carboxypeptidase LdcB
VSLIFLLLKSMGSLSIRNSQSGISLGQVSQLLGRMPAAAPAPQTTPASSWQPDALQTTPRAGIPANGLLMSPQLLKNWNAIPPEQLFQKKPPNQIQAPPVQSLPAAPLLPQRPVNLPSLPPVLNQPQISEPDLDSEMEDPDLIDTPDGGEHLNFPSDPTQIPIPRPRPILAPADHTAVAPKPQPKTINPEVHDTGLKDKYGRAIKLTGEAEQGLLKILDIAKSKGIRVEVFSSYRSVEHQRELFNKAIKKYGSAAKARKWVAPPGHSRHNFGKAIDVHMYRNGKKISQKEFDSLIAQAGMYRPMSWEGWHIEPLSTRKGRS